MLKNVKPIGITPERVTVIPVESQEIPRGQVRFEKAKQKRPRVWATTWREGQHKRAANDRI